MHVLSAADTIYPPRVSGEEEGLPDREGWLDRQKQGSVGSP